MKQNQKSNANSAHIQVAPAVGGSLPATSIVGTTAEAVSNMPHGTGKRSPGDSVSKLKRSQFIERLEVGMARELPVGRDYYCQKVDVSDLHFDNFRQTDDHTEDSALKTSIAENGLLTPIIVTLKFSRNGGAFLTESELASLSLEAIASELQPHLVVVDGHRRTHAYQRLYIEEVAKDDLGTPSKYQYIKALFRPTHHVPGRADRSAVLTNLVRRTLHPLDEAFALKRLRDTGMNIKQMASELGKGEDMIRKTLDISSFPEELLAVVRSNPRGFTLKWLHSMGPKVKRISTPESLQGLKSEFALRSSGSVKAKVNQTDAGISLPVKTRKGITRSVAESRLTSTGLSDAEIKKVLEALFG